MVYDPYVAYGNDREDIEDANERLKFTIRAYPAWSPSHIASFRNRIIVFEFGTMNHDNAYHTS